MSFWIGYAAGIVTVLVVLPFTSKLLIKLAMKRQMNTLLESVTKAGSQFDNLIKTSVMEEKVNVGQEDSTPK